MWLGWMVDCHIYIHIHMNMSRQRRKAQKAKTHHEEAPEREFEVGLLVQPRTRAVLVPLVRPEIVIDVFPLRDIMVIVRPEHQHYGQRDVVVDDAVVVVVAVVLAWGC